MHQRCNILWLRPISFLTFRANSSVLFCKLLKSHILIRDFLDSEKQRPNISFYFQKYLVLKIKSRKVSNVLRKKKSISTYGPSHPELLSSYIQASVLYLVSPTSKLGREHPVSSDHLWSASSEWERSGFSGKVLNCCHRKMERIHASFHRPEFLPLKILSQIVDTGKNKNHQKLKYI